MEDAQLDMLLQNSMLLMPDMRAFSARIPDARSLDCEHRYVGGYEHRKARVCCIVVARGHRAPATNDTW